MFSFRRVGIGLVIVRPLVASVVEVLRPSPAARRIWVLTKYQNFLSLQIEIFLIA
jgi:hypothetical protein